MPRRKGKKRDLTASSFAKATEDRQAENTKKTGEMEGRYLTAKYQRIRRLFREFS
jgi:hypothetical protein